MRKHIILDLTALVAGLTLVAGVACASGAGQTAQPIGGPGTKYYPTTETLRPGPLTGRSNPAEDYRKGVIAFKAGNYREAIANFNIALGLAPKDSNTWTMLGLAKEGDGDLNGARDAYAKAVGYNGGNIAARQRLGVTGAMLGKTEQSKAELADLQKRAGACGDGCSDAARLKAAVAAVEEALAKAPAAARPKG
ncbi:MAG TPA: hypothetical protein VG407_08240 [Caulobacteraceae bacterium]|jgi:Flp pilus assembly protein TadD|nr:hypothetical protein [Caulobacteraceae bacterium]